MAGLRFALLAAVVLLAGLGILTRLSRRPRSGPGLLGLGFVVGALGVALWIHLLLLVRVPVNLLTVAVGAAALAALLRVSALREADWSVSPGAAALFLPSVVVLVWGALALDTLGWDGDIFYAFKAKSILRHGGIWNEDFLDPERLHLAHRRPLLLPCLYVEVALGTGVFDTTFIRLWFSLMQIAAWAGMLDLLRSLIDRRQALGAAALYSWIPILSRDTGGANTGWADAPLSMMFLFALGSERPLSVFFLCAGALTKDEGQAFLVGFLIAHGWRPVVIPAVVAGIWILTARHLPLDSDYLPRNFLNANFSAIPRVLRHVGSALLSLKHWAVLWVVSLTVLAFRVRRLNREDARWLVPIAVQLAIYVGVWITFPKESIQPMMRVQDTRLLLHLAPAMWVWAAWRAGTPAEPTAPGRPADAA